MRKVIIYTTTYCPWCKKTKEFFKEHKVSFIERNVEESEKFAREMIERSGQQGVPVIEIGKEIVVGFDEQRLRRVLKIK